jgi:hypothetical protein
MAAYYWQQGAGSRQHPEDLLVLLAEVPSAHRVSGDDDEGD